MANRVAESDGWDRTEAQLAAAAWACEMTSLEAAAEQMGRVLWEEFDAVLDDVAGGLTRMVDFFGFEASAEAVSALADSPLLGRYSKAVEYEYSPRLRLELLAQAQQRHGPEISDSLQMLERAADSSPLLRRALGRTGSER